MYKSRLQELCHQRSWTLPEYRTVKDGPDHNPRFTSTVTVNGLSFDTPLNQCRSSKEAQNLAAQLAYDHLLSITPPPIHHSLNIPIPLPSSPFSGSSSSSSQAESKPASQAISHPNQVNDSRAARFNVILSGKDDKMPKDILHTYKNRLQHYAQKHNLSLPAYRCEFNGPPHARLFKSKVTIADKTYETSEYFPTLKEAEHAAAKVAFESLSRDDIQEDEGLFKTLLQELAQKQGLIFPTYSTVRSGPSHMPTFISTVQIGADAFQGREGKTKKQAEMSAAKVAYNALAERRVMQIPSQYQIKETSSVPSLNLGSTSNNGLQQDVASNPVNMEKVADSKDMHNSAECISKETLAMSTSSIRCDVPADLQHNFQPEVKLICDKEPRADRVDAITCGFLSSSEELNAHLLDPMPISSSDHTSSPLTEPMHPNDVVIHCKKQKSGETGASYSGKFVVVSRNANTEIPEGAVILPCSDNQWIAFRTEGNQEQKSSTT